MKTEHPSHSDKTRRPASLASPALGLPLIGLLASALVSCGPGVRQVNDIQEQAKAAQAKVSALMTEDTAARKELVDWRSKLENLRLATSGQKEDPQQAAMLATLREETQRLDDLKARAEEMRKKLVAAKPAN